jgi:hypothetical protein
MIRLDERDDMGTRYFPRQEPVYAFQFFKLGDYPGVEWDKHTHSYRHPHISGPISRGNWFVEWGHGSISVLADETFKKNFRKG